MTTRNLFTAVMFIGAGFVAFSPRAPFVAAGSDAQADPPRDCHGVCADHFGDCDKHAGPRDEHDRCAKDRDDCLKACDHH